MPNEALEAISRFVDALWRTDAAETGLHYGAKRGQRVTSCMIQSMARERSDYTRTFRMLSLTEQHSAALPLRDEFIHCVALMTGLPVIGAFATRRG
ncbi:hypothetical protein ACNKHW_09395 [Shigella flexneri]